MRALVVVGLAVVPGCLLLDGFTERYEVTPALDLELPCQEQPAQACRGVWSAPFGNGATVEVGDLALGGEDELFVVGSYAGSLSLGVETVTAVGTDAFLAAYDTDGQLRAAVTSGLLGDERATAVAASGSRVVVGGSYGLGFGGCGDDPAGDGGVFLSFASAGSLGAERVRCMVSTGSAEVEAIALAEGTVFVAGSFTGSLAMDGEPHVAQDRDGFVARFDAGNGALRGLLVVGGPGEQLITALRATVEGAFVAGSYEGRLEVDGVSHDAEGAADAFLLAVAQDGSLARSWSWGSEEDQALGALALDDDGLFVAGEVDGGALALDDVTTVVGEGERVSGFVARLPRAGLDLGPAEWLTLLAAEDLDLDRLALSGGPNRALYLGGAVDGALFVAGEGSPGGCADVFVLRLEPTTGAPAATTRCGDGAEQSLAGLVAASSDDDLFALLGLQGSINLGGAQPLLARGTQDGLLAQLDVAP